MRSQTVGLGLREAHKGTEKASDRDIRRVSYSSLIRALYTFTTSTPTTYIDKIRITIERSYQTHPCIR